MTVTHLERVRAYSSAELGRMLYALGCPASAQHHGEGTAALVRLIRQVLLEREWTP